MKNQGLRYVRLLPTALLIFASTAHYASYAANPDNAVFKNACESDAYKFSRAVQNKILVTCSKIDKLKIIDSKQQVEASYNTGKQPGAADVTDDGVLAFVPNLGEASVSVIDLLNAKNLTTTKVCKNLRGGVMAADNVTYIVDCEASKQYINTATFKLVNQPAAPIETKVGKHGKVGEPNEVIVMGMIHGEHLESKLYGLKTIEKLLRRIAPDVTLVEIPPNRFELADQQFKKTGKITEERVEVFPEYIDVMFPLRKALGYQIAPTAGWSEAMNTYRSAAMKRISNDPARAKEWADYQAAIKRSAVAVKQGGADDDPAWLHTDAYDAALEIELSAYNHFDPELGRGGWDTINKAHYGNIVRWLDTHKNQGKRVLITYGAAHKGWFLRQLRQRSDIKLIDLQEFLRD